MTPQVGNQNQSQLWGIGIKGFTGGGSEWGKDGRKKRLDEGSE